MQKTIRLLALLLGVQLMVAVALGLSGSRLSVPAQAGPLVEVDKARVDRLTIEGPDSAKVTLAKVDGQWRLPDAGDFPADGKRVDQLLDRLVELKAGTPVANSRSAQERFKVDEKQFERRITLDAGSDTLATLYLGTSPGLRRIHARKDGEEAIHSVEFASYDAPARPADWEDKTVLAVPRSEVRAIEVAGLKIRRKDVDAKDSAAKDTGQKDGAQQAAATGQTGAVEKADGADAGAGAAADDGGWVAEGLAADERLAGAAVDKLLDQLADLRFVEVRGREAKPEYGLDEPVLTLTLTRATGEPVTYRLGKAQDADDYTLQTSSRPELFLLGSGTAKSLVDAAKREALVGAESPA